MSLWLIPISAFFAQDYRFMIAEDYGCNIAVLNSWVTLVVFTLPPILLEIVAGVYGCLSVYSFYKLGHRSHLQCFSRYQNLNANRYVRLMCFSLCDLFVGLPLATTFLYFELSPPGLVHYPGLKQAHAHISEILPVPAFAWRATLISELSFELHRWSIVGSGFVFFANFGLTRESRNTYRAALQSVVQFVLRRKAAMKSLRNSPPASSKAEECVSFFSSYFCSPPDIADMCYLDSHSSLQVVIH
jgi:pheromone a factor receptor